MLHMMFSYIVFWKSVFSECSFWYITYSQLSFIVSKIARGKKGFLNFKEKLAN